MTYHDYVIVYYINNKKDLNGLTHNINDRNEELIYSTT